jgi:hypothetical protein
MNPGASFILAKSSGTAPNPGVRTAPLDEAWLEVVPREELLTWATHGATNKIKTATVASSAW